MTPNEIMNPSSEAEPKVGMGVTILWYSDRRPGTIVRVSKSGKTFWYKDDDFTRIDNNGMSESQEYTFSSDLTNEHEWRARKCKNGRWIDQSGHTIAIGYRDAYYDFSF